MQQSRSQKSRCIYFVAVIFIILSTAGLFAQDSKKKTSNPPAKPAAPAKPATSARSRPAGGPSSGVSHGPSTAGVTHQGPTTANPRGQGGPTANRPAGPTANGPGTGAPRSVTANGPGLGKVPATGSGHVANTSVSGKPVPGRIQQTKLTNGSALQKRPNGRVSDVHDAKRGMDVHHGINGGERVSVERPGHSRIVAERGRPGYVQRGYTHNGHEFARRTYYFNGRAYDRYYRGYLIVASTWRYMLRSATIRLHFTDGS